MKKLNLSNTDANIDKIERTQSFITGAALLYTGIRQVKKQPAVAALKAIFGAYFVYRGLTGHCHLNQMLERNSSKE